MTYLDLLLESFPGLHLTLELDLCLFVFLLVSLLVFLELLLVILQQALRLLQSFLPFVGLTLQIGDLIIDDFVSHGDKEHLLLLLQDVHDYFLLSTKVLVLLSDIDQFKCLLDDLLVLSIVHSGRDVLLVYRDTELVEPLERVSMVRCCLFPNLLIGLVH